MTDAYGGVDTSSSVVARVVLPRLSTAVTVPPVPVHSLTAIVLAYDVFPDDTVYRLRRVSARLIVEHDANPAGRLVVHPLNSIV